VPPIFLPQFPPASRLLSTADFRRLADVPLEIEWFANIDKAQTRRVYKNALEDFIKFTGIERPDEFGEITRAHIIAWAGRSEVPGAEQHDHPTSPGRAVPIVRISVRLECRDPQSGQRHQTATSGRL